VVVEEEKEKTETLIIENDMKKDKNIKVALDSTGSSDSDDEVSPASSPDSTMKTEMMKITTDKVEFGFDLIK